MRRLLALVALFAACGKSAPPASTSSGSGSAPAPTSPVGTTPHLFGALEGVELGASKDDVVKHVPELAPVDGPHPTPYAGEGWIDHQLEYLAGKHGDMTYRVTLTDGKLTNATIALSIKRDELVRAWGASMMTRSTGAKIFLDRTKHVRGVVVDDNVSPISISLEPYVPLDSIVDHDPTKLFGTQVVGRPVVDVIKDIEPHSIERSDWTFDLPPTEYADESTSLTLYTDDDEIVTSWLLDKTAYRPSTEMSLDLEALAQKLWGDATPVDPRFKYTAGASQIIVDPRFGSFSQSESSP